MRVAVKRYTLVYVKTGDGVNEGCFFCKSKAYKGLKLKLKEPWILMKNYALNPLNGAFDFSNGEFFSNIGLQLLKTIQLVRN